MTRARLVLPLLLGAIFGASLGISAEKALQNRPFATVMLAADGTGALSAVSTGPCGTLGPLTPGASVLVSADGNGALSICGSFGGSGSGSVTTIEENNVQLGGADIIVIDFLGADFDLTESPDTEVNVVIAAALTRDAEWDTSAEIFAAVGDETGSGALVGGTSPTFTTSAIFGTAGVSITDDADGGWTWLGRGNGSDEDLTWNFDDVSNEIGLSSSTGVAIIDFGTINVEVPCTAYNEATWNGSEQVPCMDAVRDQFEALVVGGAVAYDDVADPDANSTIAFAGFTNLWTSTLDNGIVFEISDTDADAAADTILLKLSHNDGADANVIFLQLIGDKDGTPATVFQVSQTAASFGVALTLVEENYDDTGWNGNLTAATKDDIRDIIATFITPDAEVATWLATPSLANFCAAQDGEGTGVCTALGANTNATDGIVTPNGTATLTGKTLDVEGTGNVLTTVHEVTFPVAVCQNATATLGGNTASTLAPTAVCETTAAASGDPAQGFATFPTGGADTEWHQYWGRVPTGFTGNFDAIIHWRAISTTTNDVVWRVAVGCVAAGEALTAISYNTTSFTADTNLGTTLQLNDTATTTLTTTGCAAGEQMYIKLLRDTDTAGDTLDADVQAQGITFIYRKAQ